MWLKYLAYDELRYYYNHIKIIYSGFFLFLGLFFIYDLVWCFRIGFFIPDWPLLTTFISSFIFELGRAMFHTLEDWYLWFDFHFIQYVAKYLISYYIRIQRYRWLLRFQEPRYFITFLINEWIFLETKSTQKFAEMCFVFKFPLAYLLKKYIWGSMAFYCSYIGNLDLTFLSTKPAEYHSWQLFNMTLRVWGLDDLWLLIFGRSINDPIFTYGKSLLIIKQPIYNYFLESWNKNFDYSGYEIIYHKSFLKLSTTRLEKFIFIFGLTSLCIHLSLFFNIFVLFLTDYLANQRVMLLSYCLIIILMVSALWV